MTTHELNNLWRYLQGLSLSRSDREWLANKLLEPTEVDAETKRQQEFGLSRKFIGVSIFFELKFVPLPHGRQRITDAGPYGAAQRSA